LHDIVDLCKFDDNKKKIQLGCVMNEKIGVLLSGCGVFDGVEIHESTLTLYFLDLAKADILCIAPDITQLHVIDHQTSCELKEKRNVLIESARISRGNMRSLSSVSSNDLDGLILPGGFGAVKNLTDYAVNGRGCSINPDVKRLLLEMVDAKKPVGAMCIAPMVLAVAFRGKSLNPLLTIGTDTSTAADLEFFGARHQDAQVDQVVIDEQNKLVTTPAYMLGPAISDIAKGIEKLVNQVLQLI
jgi:enhancing lycopene biosynthesis protein 2